MCSELSRFNKMCFKKAIILCLVLICGCKDASNTNSSANADENILAANAFIDAFYSFNPDSLKSVLTYAEKSQPSIVYYQGWAEGGNYEIIERHPLVLKSDSLIICSVTVKDDLIEALEINFNVTDTFHIEVVNGQILSVTTSSNDPTLYHEAKAWVKQNRANLIEEPCQGIWDGGPTPGDCVRAMVSGYSEFLATKK